MANKVKYGVQNLYYAKVTETTSGETYGTPVALKGAVSISLDSKDESATFYADNSEFFETLNKKGYEGSFELALLPDTFKTDILGQRTDSKGMLVEQADDKYSYFALLFQLEGDDSARRGVLYKCIPTSSPQIASSTTNESADPVTDTINFKAVKSSKGYIKAKCESTATTAYEAFFTTVQEPGTFVI